jgi:hypothetical protein
MFQVCDNVVDDELSVSSDISDDLEIGESQNEDDQGDKASATRGEQNGAQLATMYLKEEEESELDSSFNAEGVRSR